MAKDTAFYKKEIEKLDTWDKLRAFWQAIQNGETDTNIWSSGKAFEFFILRCFEIDGATVKYPYTVEIFDEVIEQIDGVVHYKNLNCIIESKDYREPVNVTPLAKLRNQLIRRPAAAIGCVFVKSKFSPAAVILTKFMFPQTVLLWNGSEVDYAINKKSFCKYLYLKYKGAVEYGISDLDVTSY